MDEQPLIILASARKQSETKNFLNKVFAANDYVLIDLLDVSISPYNYSNEYLPNDEFI